MVSGVQCTVCIHVDDLLMTCVNESIIESTLTEIQKVYKQVTIKRSKVQQYLGMMLDFSVKGKCHVTMPKFTDELIGNSLRRTAMKTARRPGLTALQSLKGQKV